MIDIQLLREDPEGLRRAIEARKGGVDLDELIALDMRRREIVAELDELNRQAKAHQKSMGSKIKDGGDAEALRAEGRALGDRRKEKEKEASAVRAGLDDLLLTIPNPPHESTPIGLDEDEFNQTVATWGEKPKFDHRPKPHWELGEALGILDFHSGAKLTGSGFYVLKGQGAALQRALIGWMLDVHVAEHGYTEVNPPHLVNSATMTGTGQLPKMADDMYRIEGEDLWLIPTAEVPVTNLHADQILEPRRLPLRYVAFTPCFRREAGSYGKEVRGITRVHQFDKVEMVQIVEPEGSYDVHEELTRHAETLLERLGLHYRRVLLCSGGLSFAAAKCYDLEVWAPGMEMWLEVSSCSNFGDFQSRRASIRYRPEKGAKPRFPHTINGSGLALPRLMIALLETYQQEDGTVKLPEPIAERMGCDRIGQT